MDCSNCNLIQKSPIKLHDGRTVCSYCEDWRLECEARHVMKMPEKSTYLEAIKKKRGEKAMWELMEAIKSLK
jgi:hypothetical protein